MEDSLFVKTQKITNPYLIPYLIPLLVGVKSDKYFQMICLTISTINNNLMADYLCQNAKKLLIRF